MLIKFNPVQFKQNINFKAKITTQDILTTLNSLESLSSEQRINALNGITVPIKNNGHDVLDGDSLVIRALQYTPTDNTRRATSRYLTEVYRLQKYLGADKPETMDALSKVAANRNATDCFNKSVKLFQFPETNVAGKPICAFDYDECAARTPSNFMIKPKPKY